MRKQVPPEKTKDVLEFATKRPEERLATLADEGRHRDVLALLERQLAKYPRAPNLLAAVARSSAALGDYGRAADVLKTYLAVRPDDLAARERQADHLLQNGSIGRYLDVLSILIAARPSPDGVTRLIELYRLHGRADEELAILRTYAGKAMLNHTQLERLGAILAERRQWREAQCWLKLADQNAPSEASAGRLLLFDVLIESNENDEAYQHAQMWIKAWQSPFLSGKQCRVSDRLGHYASTSHTPPHPFFATGTGTPAILTFTAPT